MTFQQIVAELKALANRNNVEGMARYGINPADALGVPMPVLRKIAKGIGRRHDLADDLWRSGIHEARILASLIDDPEDVTDRQMERWVLDIDSWDICDQLCSNLLSRTGLAYRKAVLWSGRPETFVKRAGFVMMACLAVHDKKTDDAVFAAFLPLIVRGADDERNFVKKAVNWALRQIGKRNAALNGLAVKTARDIRKVDSKAARWIGSDAVRELTSEKVLFRLHQGDGNRKHDGAFSREIVAMSDRLSGRSKASSKQRSGKVSTTD